MIRRRRRFLSLRSSLLLVAVLSLMTVLLLGPEGAAFASPRLMPVEPGGRIAHHGALPPTPTSMPIPTGTPVPKAAPSVIAQTTSIAKPAQEAVSHTVSAAVSVPERIVLDADTQFPVRAKRFVGWGYEIVDASNHYDVVLNRDVFGVVMHRLWQDSLYKRHPSGLRLTIMDAVLASGCSMGKQQYPLAPVQLANAGDKCGNAGLDLGFGDGESAWLWLGCADDDPTSATIVRQDPEECFIAIAAGGPNLDDITVTAAAMAYGSRGGWRGNPPDFSQAAFADLGQVTREPESGQWRWRSPFLQLISLDTPSAAPSLATGPAAPRAPAAPPGGHIAFSQGNGGGSDIAVVDVATGKARVVAVSGRQPNLRGDGVIVFNGQGGGRDDLQKVQIDGSELAPISKHPEDSYPDWSPNGQSLLYHSSQDGGKDRIFVQWDGRHAVEPSHLQVYNGTARAPLWGRYPTWVDDRMAFSGCDWWHQGSKCGIWVLSPGAVDSRGSTYDAVQLTAQVNDRSSDYSAGTLLYSSAATGNWDVYAVPVTGGKPRNLTASPSQDLGASFSPDGTYIAYMSDRGGWSIWIMNADGSDPRLLAPVPQGFGPHWDEDRLSWGP
jgi:hypothetical protein